MIRTKNKSCSNAREKDICLSDLVFSWSIKDVLNKDLFKGQVKQIPQKFSSNADYLSSFKHPLIEETRADFCCSLESVAQAPSCEISSVCLGKGYKPPKSLYYEISTKFIEEDYSGCSGGGRYEPESGDLFVVTTMRPRRLNDVIRPGEPFWVAKVVFASEEHPTITILSSQQFDFDLLDKKRHNRLFATYLMNLTTNMRIWAALNPDPQSANMGLIHTVLHYDPAVDDGCTQCLLEGDVNVNGWNLLDFVGSLGLDESQKKATLSSICMRKCTHQKHKVKLIWGPPGTGKTKTVGCLLFALLKLHCRTLTCAPTNTAVLQVAEKLVSVFLDQSLEHDAYGLGDIVLFGNKKRMNINDHDKLDDVFLEYRCEILAECFKPFTGWKYTLEMMISLLKDPLKQYNDYLENGKKDDGDENDSGKGNHENEFGSDESSITDKNRKGSKKGNKKHFKEVINQQLKENKKNDSKKGKKKKNQANPSEEHASDDAHNKGKKNPEFETETQDLLTCEEYVAKIFYSNACRLTSIANDLYSHLPTTLLPLCAAKYMMILVHLLNKSLENPTKRYGDFALLMIKRENILCILNSLHMQFSGLDMKLIGLHISFSDLYLERQFWNLCLSYARLIFCTASSSVKVRRVVEMVVIDEAAQLKECESAIPFQIPGLRNAILIGDDRQLPAMVRSKASEDANFGRSLFQRLATLGKKKHLLNIQYRMHPSISIFPNKVFYENKIIDGTNVKHQSYTKSFLEGDTYGSYCFINVAKGKENFDKGHSPRNVEEAAVVDRIIEKLFKGHCITKQKVSVGVISPYKGQICQIQETLGKKYDQLKQKGFSVSVRSVDGFQGGEEDIIIISTVRSNGTGSVGFLSNHQRTNVALTRARYCLWIVGHGTTLTNSGTVWKNLVIDAKIRGCFYSSEECEDLSMTQLYAKFDFDFLKLCKAKWKVVFTDKFKASIASLKSNTINKQVTDILKKLAEGWRQPNTSTLGAGSIYGMASKLLERYKINEHLCLAWTVDILKEESQYTQVIKVWDILPVSQIKELVKELNILYETYTVDFVNLCKQKSIDGCLVVPMSWPLHSIGSNLSANLVDCLAGQLAAIDLRDNRGESSSRFSPQIDPRHTQSLESVISSSSSVSPETKMSSSLMAGASSSCSATFSSRAQPSTCSNPCLPPLHLQKTQFNGLSIHDAKRVIFSSISIDSEKKGTNLSHVNKGLEIKARTAGAAKTIEVEVDKPLGLTLGQKPNGGVVITAVDGSGNAAKAGLKSGDQVLYTSSFFGDELWPADKLGFTKTAIQAKPDSVYFVVSRGAEVDVKKLTKRPAPPRFGRKLTDTQKARATHICLDCGFIYTLQKPFDEQPDTYACPQCRAPKKRFARYDVNTGKAIGGALPPIGVIIGLLAGVGAVGALLVYGLQ